MSTEIKNLEPKSLWKNFYDLTQIPRPSKKEAKIIAFMKKFGENLGLDTVVDEVGNVIIKKPATPGMENRKTVVLQGHIDMVPQKNNDVDHDFEKDPIDAYIDGDWVTARGTTLGADNGMGVAAAMSVLESKDIAHGPIEALFTIDEETGMTGAFGLKNDVLNGDILMNLDSEDEGELYVGCAGGTNATMTFHYKETKVDDNVAPYKLILTGLKGGHSGMDIILQRGNANKLMIRFLKKAIRELGVRLSSFDGGSLRNAIPRDAYAVITVPVENEKTLIELVAEYQAIYKNEFSEVEPNLEFTVEKTDMPKSVIEEMVQDDLVNAVYACPNGVIRMSDTMKGMVETSTNLAKVKSENGSITVLCLLRSSVDSAKEDLGEAISSVFQLAGAEVVLDGEYPGWKPNMDSPILKEMKSIYNNLYGKVPEIKAIHAGLECGLLGGVYPNLDMISFGPTIRFPHSPDEKVNIETVEKFWNFLVETLKEVPEK
ncbi:MAG: cytosol nonspecific dipeptidase [Bacteroidetes bacterium]|nr:MAG: cytosol nonspecific dipeptidase [Bacteroidota bacterium]